MRTRQGLRSVLLTLRRAVVLACYRQLFSRLPQSNSLVVLESHFGAPLSDSPLRMYQTLRDHDYFKTIVALNGDAYESTRHEYATAVRRGSLRHAWYLARARFWLDNHAFDSAFGKRPRTVYVQTWHGQPLKKMGRHVPGLPETEWQRVVRDVSNWDWLCVASLHDESVLLDAMAFKGEVLRTGLPRNDALLQAAEAERRRAATRQRLEVAAGDFLVLYAPTFREQAGQRPLEHFDLAAWAAAVPQNVQLILRLHYFDAATVASFPERVRDVSAEPDITDLYLASDLLITDYSSVLFDFALTEKPQLFFMYDYEDYCQLRGMYLEPAQLPGEVVHCMEDLMTVIQNFSSGAGSGRARRNEFRRRYGEYERGVAADEVLSRMLREVSS